MPAIELAASDEVLMELVMHSDSAAFEELYRRHCGRTLRAATSICHDHGRAEDAVQEGFCDMWRARRTYQLASGSFGAWAMTIVKRRAIDSLRVEAARPRLVGSIPEQPSQGQASTHEIFTAHEDDAAVHASIRKLPAGQAEAIELAFIRQLSHSEIAARLDLPAGTVKGRIRLGLAGLRRSLVRSQGSGSRTGATG